MPGPAHRARLYATAHGVLQMAINGRPVSEDILAPGWTAYRDRLLVEAYDVTDLLRVGDNVITAMVGDGWYRGRLGWGPDGGRGRYGTDVALLAQLEVELDDGSELRVTTDTEWRASNGTIRAADFYDGSTIDLREAQDGWELPGFEDGTWARAVEVPFDREVLEPRIAPPVRVAASIPVVPVEVRPGLYRIDGGQNVTGHVRLHVRGRRDQIVTVRHAEVLEPDGSLHTRSLRSAKATDTYVLADDRDRRPGADRSPSTASGTRRSRPTRTYSTPRVVAISSATPRRGNVRVLRCGPEPVPRERRLVSAGQLRLGPDGLPATGRAPRLDRGRTGLRVDGMHACSTRSRSGPAGCAISRSIRTPCLGVPSVVPDVVLQGEARFGRAGWADAATIVPWAVYEAYGDIRGRSRPVRRACGRWIESLIASMSGRTACWPNRLPVR